MEKVLSVEQIRLADQYTIRNEPIASLDLMERASWKLYEWLDRKYKESKQRIVFHIFCGVGNNGGDGLALSRYLNENGYQVFTYLVYFSEKLSPDCKSQLDKLPRQHYILKEEFQLEKMEENAIIVDAIFGSGLSKPISGWLKKLINELNSVQADKIAIDCPSGLFGEDNSANDYRAIFKADFTLSFQSPKLSFLLPDNFNFVGEWTNLDIGLDKEFIEQLNASTFLIEDDFIKSILKKKSTASHKGTNGNALIVAGSKGKIGAALLSSESCLRSGVGLLTVHLPGHAGAIMHETLMEAMVSYDTNENLVSEIDLNKDYDAIGVGPGLGNDTLTRKAFESLLENYKKPIVIDADAINMLSEKEELKNLLIENSILTPHPGEFRRLVGDWKNSNERLNKQIEFSKKFKVIVVLKGKNTSISSSEGEVFFNTSGNEGMATAGSGDVLTGIITSFLAQKYSPINAALLGVFIHGLAGDFAAKKMGTESLIASDITASLSDAFKKLKTA